MTILIFGFKKRFVKKGPSPGLGLREKFLIVKAFRGTDGRMVHEEEK